MMGWGETLLWRCGGKVVPVWLLQLIVLLLLDRGSFSYHRAGTSSKVLWVLVCVCCYQLSNGGVDLDHGDWCAAYQAAYRNVSKQVILKLSFFLFSHFLLLEDWKGEWDKWQHDTVTLSFYCKLPVFIITKYVKKSPSPNLKSCWMWALSALPARLRGSVLPSTHCKLLITGFNFFFQYA